ncbi:MAG: YciI-like protein [Paraglaciecola polaris]|uniref:YciI-like protein n=1 Tax=Paraglaciecola polaris TaxID=222814 RepID=UPI00300135D8|tara:strand:+ start:5368 stop:5661 length:294 start_codon:yes stop_codon:yes gene_type:complete
MYYLLTYDVKADYLTTRGAFREEHLKLALSAVSRGELRLGGALTEPTLGAALLFEGSSAKVAEDFAAQDPYVLNGLVKSWQVNEWAIVLGAGVENPN